MTLDSKTDQSGSKEMPFLVLITLLAVVAATVFFGSYRSSHTASTATATASTESLPRQRRVQLHQIYRSTDSKGETYKGVDIIAIHGLDTKSPDTWEFKTSGEDKVNWLKDEHMLPAEVSNVRIFTCDWPAELFETVDSERDTIEELARLLLVAIKERPPAESNGAGGGRNQPILFIASCLGGIMLMKSLVMTRDEQYIDIRTATRGVVFLATPFQGTSFQDVARWAEPGLKAMASVRGHRVTMLLEWAGPDTNALLELKRSFVVLATKQSYHIDTFYEKGFTDLSHKVPFLSFILPTSKQLVWFPKHKSTVPQLAC